MKTILLAVLATAFGGALAHALPGPTNPDPVHGTVLVSSATITLGVPIVTFAPLPPRPPYTLQRGTHIQFLIDASDLTNPTVTWYKDGRVLSVGGPTLDIASATPADSGVYTATATNAGGTTVAFSSDSARVLITEGGQRLLNMSTRARIEANQPSFLSGFVIEPGPAQTMVLVRAIGPALATFGIPDALATPQLKVMDVKGRELTPLSAQPIEGVSIYPTPEAAAARVGAFPLPTGSRDAAQVYLLGQGAYGAQLSSSSAATGVALLEIYEVPLTP